jgi:hypothetical protein
MSRKDISTIHLIYSRETREVSSLLTIPIELRKDWVTHRLVTGMAATVKEVRNLQYWELACYYYEDTT